MLANLVLVLVLAAAPEPTPPHRTSFAQFSADTVAACLADVRRDPRPLLPYARLLRLTLNPVTRQPALSALESLTRPPATRNGALLYLASARFKFQEVKEAEALLHASLEGFRRDRAPLGEIYGRLSLEILLRMSGRVDEATEQIRLAEALASGIEDPVLDAEIRMLQGWEAFVAHDHGRALSLFESARDVLDPAPNGYLASLAWQGIAAAATALGRERDAFQAELSGIAALERDRTPTVEARVGLADHAFYLADVGGLPWTEVDRLISEGMDEARRAGAAWAFAQLRYLYALRLGETPERERELDSLLAQARATGNPYQEALIGWQLGLLRAHLHPESAETAEQLVTRAFELSRDRHFLAQMGNALEARALIRWEQGSSAGALADTDAALKLQDLDRDRQFEESARISSQDWRTYVNLMVPAVAHGRLVEAFDVSERMRARALLEEVRGGRREIRLPPDLLSRRGALRSRLVELQTSLADEHLPSNTRDERKRELAQAESEERRLDDEAARVQGRPVEAPGPLTVASIQQALGPDEALLSFVVAPDGRADHGDHVVGPRAFVFLITRNAIRANRIPDADALPRELSMFLALVENDAQAEPAAAVRLYRQLLAEALGELGPEVRRLILVPWGSLHALPFELLRPSASEGSLGERFAISRAPSATLWALWRQRPAATGRAPLLALADPGIGSRFTAQRRQGAPWLEGLSLDALPEARREAVEAVQLVGHGSQVLLGPDASEHALKTISLRRWSVLHLAAHAVVDDEVPMRSAVVLAPGSPDEDGLLQIRDVAGLDLDDMLVVLAACRSASGRLSPGEGPVGLSRAFLASRARGVVVSLWAVADAASRRFFRDFYAQLSDGQPVQEALLRARQARIREGEPAVNWAGWVVIGDGGFRLRAVGQERSPVASWVVVAVGLSAGAMLLARTLRARRRTRKATAGVPNV